MGTRGHLLDLMISAPLLTLVSILAMWGALGREAWTARLSVLLLTLPGIGTLLGATNQRPRRWRWDRLFPASEMGESIEIGIVWAVLAGVLLAGLLLVFRTSGSRLQQKPK